MNSEEKKMNKRKYVNSIVHFSKSKEFNEVSLLEMGYSDSDEANKLIFEDKLAFLTGLLFDQSISSNLAWKAPLLLSQRLGHLDLAIIAKMNAVTLTKVVAKEKALHRYPSKVSDYLISSCKTIIEEFNSNPSKLWEGLSTESARFNLLKLKGIGRKKANFGLLLLARDQGVKFEDMQNIEIAIDIHLKRVLCRSGFFRTDEVDTQTEISRYLSTIVDCPALLSTPMWYIGRHYCRETNPLCMLCPLSSQCRRTIT